MIPNIKALTLFTRRFNEVEFDHVTKNYTEHAKDSLINSIAYLCGYIFVRDNATTKTTIEERSLLDYYTLYTSEPKTGEFTEINIADAYIEILAYTPHRDLALWQLAYTGHVTLGSKKIRYKRHNLVKGDRDFINGIEAFKKSLPLSWMLTKVSPARDTLIFTINTTAGSMSNLFPPEYITITYHVAHDHLTFSKGNFAHCHVFKTLFNRYFKGDV